MKCYAKQELDNSVNLKDDNVGKVAHFNSEVNICRVCILYIYEELFSNSVSTSKFTIVP